MIHSCSNQWLTRLIIFVSKDKTLVTTQYSLTTQEHLIHSAKTTVASNVQNRSPWQVTVRNHSDRNTQFPFNNEKKAKSYLAKLQELGLKASLVQLETSFQLRIRRQGVKQQFITIDTLEAAEQARLHIEADLSVSIVRDYDHHLLVLPDFYAATIGRRWAKKKPRKASWLCLLIVPSSFSLLHELRISRHRQHATRRNDPGRGN